MQYILLLYSQESGWSKLTPAEQKKWMRAYQDYFKALSKAGVLISANHIESSKDTKTVSVKNGKTKISKKPVMDSKKQLAGYFIIEVADQEEAILWATRHPAAKHGQVEVRALGTPPI